jgi:hypothetical protein
MEANREAEENPIRMSSGHSKVQVLPGIAERLYKKAKADPEFQAYLNRSFKVNYNYPIPYLGGYSEDGKTIYIDRGFTLEALDPFLIIHENWEKTAIEVWQLSYWYAHALATYAEHQAVIRRGKETPLAYERRLKPFIHTDEEEEAKDNGKEPKDLDQTPYEAPDKPPKEGRNPFA